MNQNIKYTCPANNAHYLLPGPQGDQGPRGIPGKDGRDGKNGRDGINGLNGKNGNDGAEGKQGEQGLKGNKGEHGRDGSNGPEGLRGPMGVFSGRIKQNLIPDLNGKISNGYSLGDEDHWYSEIWAKEGHFSEGSIFIGDLKLSTREVNGKSSLILPSNIIIGEPEMNQQQTLGQKGEPGAQGIKGIDGIKGVSGDIGPHGVAGPEGKIGIRGYKGEKGEKGEEGLQGQKGDIGFSVKGEKGETGDKGEQAIAKIFNIYVENNKYKIDNKGNPNIYLLRGQKYIFNIINGIGFPFWIVKEKYPYNSEIIYNNGIINNGSDNENKIEFKVPYDSPNELFYVSQYNELLIGNIIIRDLTPNSLAQGLTNAINISNYTYIDLGGIGNTPLNDANDGIYSEIYSNSLQKSGTNRKFSWNIEDFLFTRQQFNDLSDWLVQTEDNFLGYNFNMKEVINGGHITLYPRNNNSYNFANLYLTMNYRSIKFLLSGSNDKNSWTTLLNTDTSTGLEITSNNDNYYTYHFKTYKFTFTNTNYYHYWQLQLISSPINNFVQSIPIFKKPSFPIMNSFFNSNLHSEQVDIINIPDDVYFLKLEGGPITIKYLEGHELTTGLRIVKITDPLGVISSYEYKLQENIAIIGPSNNSNYNVQEEITLTDDQVYYFIVYHGQGYNAKFSVTRGLSQFRINDLRFS